ncbi:MAG: hypothetical protein B7Y56_14985 [Gallionellales bacterium 35-53-114]|jgi:hypothetical protein|nr:MAG: hypothetical protein B7Y56_14985 [Gallionellales bacterium 35-53-114]OYZ62134.1 MAG: hypothetical protein B7Y04_15435 [Gallionellales bacterium 24-53-125]OZB07304.1 MAG: hypothetical protein B7X61_15185 [Gallionellales bacterium 39-52-133]HQS59851.1 hypothetical protein [Gallionellaceae bacterium]HQS76605.1 hypothetical protein [Gallionellaceae bacterium]
MFKSRILASCTLVLLVLPGLALPSFALADGKTALTYGYDQNGYRSFAFKGDIDLSSDVLLHLDHLHAESSGIVSLRQSGIGLTAYATDWLSGHYRYSETNDTVFLVRGNEGDLSVALNSLWNSELRTTLGGGYAGFIYANANPPDTGGGRSLSQSRRSYSLSQDLTSSLGAYVSFDQYAYEVDLVDLIILLIRRARIAPISAGAFLSFPDITRAAGLTWKATDKLTFDLSSSKTTTILEQSLISSRLGVDYQLSDTWNAGVAVTRSTTSDLLRNTGVVVQPATDTTFNEVRASWYF